ncbi:sialate O-acetylesterase [Planctomycetota bacterium]
MLETRIRLSIWLIALLPSLLPGLLRAGELRVADVFTDHAVLQRGVNLPVWGTTTASENVTVRFAGQQETVQAAEDGSWKVVLSPLQANASGNSMVVESGKQRREFRNLLVGEVWYASGQSNMQMSLDACARRIPAIKEMAEAAPSDDIRMLRVDDADSPQPLTQRQKATSWQIDNPSNRRGQSAVAYFFARQLHETLDVPIGVIEGSWGGKPIEGFIPRDQFEMRAPLRPILALAEQDRLADLAALKGGVVVRNTAGLPGRIFNARVAPIAPYGLRGVIWYQGESNAGRGEDPQNYRIKMRALVDGFRSTWNQPKMPCYFVQLPAFNDQATGWVRLREEQRLSLDIEHTGMAVTIDLRDADIHPANKLDVGKRLARWALAKTYGRKIPFSGPLFKSATVEGASMLVEFEHAESGLMVARKEGLGSLIRTSDVELAHFELANEDGEWHPAQATIDGEAVRVHSPLITNPRAVRYACSGAPLNANLYNQVGLPASPFCSELKLLPWEPGK